MVANINKGEWGSAGLNALALFPLVGGGIKLLDEGGDFWKYSNDLNDLKRAKKAKNIFSKKEIETLSSSLRIRILGDVKETLSEASQMLKELPYDPELKVGLRGSLITGIKHKKNLPFAPDDFDVDAFIVSDKLAEKFEMMASGEWWRDASLFPEIAEISKEIDDVFSTVFEGHRKGSFSFRIWTEAEYLKKIKDKGSILID